MRQLLIVWDSMTGGSEALARAAAKGSEGVHDVNLSLLHADYVQPADMIESEGYLFVFPENLAGISGVMKAFFDRCYYPCLGKIEGRPYAVIVCAGSDGSNAVQQAERIAKGWRLRKIADSQIMCTHAQTPDAILASKIIGKADLDKAQDVGALLAAGLSAGIF
jgi:multimeric flavodoxin WrbA